MMLELEPAVLVIFGLTGDLVRRKLLPALYDLARGNYLPKPFAIVGISRRGTTVETVAAALRKTLKSRGETVDESALGTLTSAMSIVDMDIAKADDLLPLKNELEAIESRLQVCLNRLFYLAIPSTLFSQVIRRLGEAGLNASCSHGTAESRLLIEKPFGHDLKSAQGLIADLNQWFTEDQIYRIDHYLAKETAQNILTFRFENPLFNYSWDREHISSIMVTAAESIGIEGRVSFYEHMGALRDLVQSHLLQLLALVTMDRPASMSAPAIHRAKARLLEQIDPPATEEMSERTVRGQYQTYRAEVGDATSMIETYAALELSIDSDRWRGVPIYLRTGKALMDKATEITVVFHNQAESSHHNYLTIRIQPNEGIVLDLRIKKPGYQHAVESVQMSFCYRGSDNVGPHPDAYERVLVDALRRDKTLFATSEELLSSWRITEPILKAWANDQVPLHTYTNGTWGPEAADALIARSGGQWITASQVICPVVTRH